MQCWFVCFRILPYTHSAKDGGFLFVRGGAARRSRVRAGRYRMARQIAEQRRRVECERPVRASAEVIRRGGAVILNLLHAVLCITGTFSAPFTSKLQQI